MEWYMEATRNKYTAVGSPLGNMPNTGASYNPGCKICFASAAMAGHPANFRGVKDEMPSS